MDFGFNWCGAIMCRHVVSIQNRSRRQCRPMRPVSIESHSEHQVHKQTNKQSAIIFIWNLYSCVRLPAGHGYYYIFVTNHSILIYFFFWAEKKRRQKKTIHLCPFSEQQQQQKKQTNCIASTHRYTATMVKVFMSLAYEWTTITTLFNIVHGRHTRPSSHDRGDLTCDNFSISTFLFDGVEWFSILSLSDLPGFIVWPISWYASTLCALVLNAMVAIRIACMRWRCHFSIMKLMKMKIHQTDLVSFRAESAYLPTNSVALGRHWKIISIFIRFFFHSLNHGLLSHFMTCVLYFPANTNRYMYVRLSAAELSAPAPWYFDTYEW